MSLLEVHMLEAGYDDALVLRGVSLNAGADEIVAVIGPNGAGKSTMLKAVYGLVRRWRGSVRFDGEDVTGWRADRLTRRGLNFVPQTENVFPTLTLAENLHVSALVLPKGERRSAIARVGELFPILMRASASTRRDPLRRPTQARRACESTRYPAETAASRRAVRRAFALRDGRSLRQARRDQRGLGIGIVMVEQNARRALALAAPRLRARGGPECTRRQRRDLLRNPQVAELYLGGSGTIAPGSTSTSAPRE